MGKLIMIRHAQSEGNAVRRFTISPDAAGITELGRRQAAAAAAVVKRMYQPARLIASTYLRARETGRIIADTVGIPMELEHGLREQSLGELAGAPYDSVRDDPSFDPARSWLWRPAGGESHADVRARAGPILDRIAAQYARDEIVIVSHGGVMRALWAHVTGTWEGAPIPPNCAIVLIEHEAGSYGAPQLIHGEAPAREFLG